MPSALADRRERHSTGETTTSRNLYGRAADLHVFCTSGDEHLQLLHPTFTESVDDRPPPRPSCTRRSYPRPVVAAPSTVGNRAGLPAPIAPKRSGGAPGSPRRHPLRAPGPPTPGLTIVRVEALRLSGSPLHVGHAQRGLRLRVRIRRHVLDRELASGLQPESDAARALRARQLTSRYERCFVAACLANILEAADERHADPASPLRLNHAEVLGCPP